MSVNVAKSLFTGTKNFWDAIWFAPVSTAPLEIVRIVLASSLFVTYGLTTTQELMLFYSDEGFVTAEAMRSLFLPPAIVSVFHFIENPTLYLVIHYIFLASFLALAFGWRTSITKWIALVAHLSYFNAGWASSYGVDALAANLMVLLCIAPIGSEFSLDRVRKRQRFKKDFGFNAELPVVRSAWACACTRMMQIQMVVFYLYSGGAKLTSTMWAEGDALWFALFDIDGSHWMLPFFAEHYWLITVGTYGALFIEIGYVFLIWLPYTRAVFLSLAILLHLGIAIIMDMPFFAIVSIAGHLIFLRVGWIRAVGRFWRERAGTYTMVYDGNCGFCKRSMAWLLGYDGLNQIKAEDMHHFATDLFTREDVNRELKMITPRQQVFGGFEAYRHLTTRLPGMWWQIPFFHVPFVSRFLGDRLYRWVAENRRKL